MMSEASAFVAFQAQLRVGDRVRHKGSGELAVVTAVDCLGPYDAYCTFEGEKTSCGVYKRNLIPPWWDFERAPGGGRR